MFADSELTDFLGDSEGVLGVSEGFGVGVLAVHEHGRVEIGEKAKLAKAEVKVKVFGGGEAWVVPGEALGQESAINHNTGVLEGVGGVHELVDINVRGREELFACKTAIFVDGEALASNNHDTGMSHEEAELFLEAIRQGNIVGIHAGDIVTFGLGEAKIEGIGDFEVSFVLVNVETGVNLGIIAKNTIGQVG